MDETLVSFNNIFGGFLFFGVLFLIYIILECWGAFLHSLRNPDGSLSKVAILAYALPPVLGGVALPVLWVLFKTTTLRDALGGWAEVTGTVGPWFPIAILLMGIIFCVLIMAPMIDEISLPATKTKTFMYYITNILWFTFTYIGPGLFSGIFMWMGILTIGSWVYFGINIYDPFRI